MIVLNILGKIDPVCISQKLKIFISNLPTDKLNNWNEGLIDEMHYTIDKTNLIYQTLKIDKTFNIKEIARSLFSELPDNITDAEAYQIIADNMICLHFDFTDEDWIAQRFDSGTCEDDYSEKFMSFINFISNNSDKLLPKSPPYCIFSTTKLLESSNKIFAFSPIDSMPNRIETMIKWGEIIDAFLQESNDFLLLDYLINSVYSDNNYNEYHYFKAYSLCQLFLEKDKEKELDEKLPQFLDKRYSFEERKELAQILRKMRNKIAHGDFIAFEDAIEEYAQKFMDGRYWFDYSEYNRKNWILLNACCLLDNALKQMISLLFTDKNKLFNIKNFKFK